MPVPSRSSSYAGRRSPPSGPSFASEHVRSPLLFVSQYSKSSLVCAATSMGSARAQSPNVTMRRTERGTCRDLIGVARDGLQGDFHRRTRRAPPPRHRNRRVATAHSGADSRAAPCGASVPAAGGAAVVLERLSPIGAPGFYAWRRGWSAGPSPPTRRARCVPCGTWGCLISRANRSSRASIRSTAFERGFDARAACAHRYWLASVLPKRSFTLASMAITTGPWSSSATRRRSARNVT